MAHADEFMTTADAMRELGVSNKTMSRLLAAGQKGEPDGLPWSPDPLDRRIKRVKRVDVLALKRQSAKSAA
jgi:hypothetical protein